MCARAYVYACVRVCMYACVCACVCVYVCLCFMCMCAGMHLYMCVLGLGDIEIIITIIAAKDIAIKHFAVVNKEGHHPTGVLLLVSVSFTMLRTQSYSIPLQYLVIYCRCNIIDL